jgi:tetratricopeptide (TPR) repeat protein
MPTLPLLFSAMMATAHAAWAPPAPARLAYSDALVALGTGQIEVAEAGFRALASRHPDCGMCQQGLGVAQLRLGRIDDARATLEAAVRAWPEQPEPWASLAAAAFAAQDFERARAAAAAGVEADPGSLEAQAALQQSLLRIGDLEAAAAALEVARPELPAPVAACLSVQLDQERGRTPPADQLAACRRAGTSDLVAGALSRSGRDSSQVGALAARMGMDPVVLVAQALDRSAEGDTAAALTLLDGALEGWPHRADARALRAQLRRQAGDAAGARADLEALLDADTWVDVHRTGATSGILRRSDAERLAATVSEAGALLVDLLREEGALDAAEARLERAEVRGPHPALSAAAARLHATRGEPVRAWQAISTGLERFPDDPRPVAAAGAVALLDPAGLPDAVRSMLAASPDWRDRLNLALALRRRGEPAACLEALDGVLVEDADGQRRVSAARYACAVEAGDAPRADAAAVRAGPASPVLRYNHALLHFNAGDYAAALAALGDLPEQLVGDPSGASPAVGGAVVGMAVRARAQTDDLDGAVGLAPAARPEDRLWLAERLADRGEPARAGAVLPEACEGWGEALDGRCAVLRARIGGR